MGKSVPGVLLSGDHAKVDKWRLDQSIERTKSRRPDLYGKYDLPGRALAFLKQDKLLHMDMLEVIRRGQAGELAVLSGGVMLRDQISGVYMVTAENKDAGERLLSLAKPGAEAFTCHQEFLADSVEARFGKKRISECCQMSYTRKQPFLEDWNVAIRLLDESFADRVFAHYNRLHTRDEVERFLRDGRLYGAFLCAEDGENVALPEGAGGKTEDGNGCAKLLAGFIGTHEEGAMGMLEVFEPYRHRGIGLALEKYLINRTLEKGYTPYCQVFSDNEASIRLQEKLGLKVCRKKIYWIS